MSNLFSSIVSGVEKDFTAVAHVLEKDYAALVKAVPAVEAVAKAELAVVKQAASNAFMYADTVLAPKLAVAVSAFEAALNLYIEAHTGGATGPGAVVIPAVEASLSAGFALLQAMITHAEAVTKTTWSLPTPTSSAAPTVAGLAAAVQAPVAAAVVSGLASVAAAANAAAVTMAPIPNATIPNATINPPAFKAG